MNNLDCINNSLSWYIELYKNNRVKYYELVTLYNPIIDEKIRINILVTLLHFKEKEQFHELHPYIELSELLKACQILDANRRINQIEKKLDELNDKYNDLYLANNYNLVMDNFNYIFNSITSFVNELLTANIEDELPKLNKRDLLKKQMNIIENKINDLTIELKYRKVLNEEIPELTLTSAKSKMVKEWTKSLSIEKLQLWQSDRKKQKWRKLADLIHLNESKDFQEKTFLSRMYD